MLTEMDDGGGASSACADAGGDVNAGGDAGAGAGAGAGADAGACVAPGAPAEGRHSEPPSSMATNQLLRLLINQSTSLSINYRTTSGL